MDPYQLMLELRNNRILFQYMEEVSVSYDEDKGWTIHGESTEGDLFIYLTTSGVARFVMPIPVPLEITVDPLLKIISSAQAKLEGLLGVNLESDTLVIEYYIHASLEDEEALDAALIKFTQERKEIKHALKELAANIRQMIKSMGGMEAMMSMMGQGRISNPSNAGFNDVPPPPPKSEDIWSTMADIEKNIDDEPLPGVESLDEDEASDEDKEV